MDNLREMLNEFKNKYTVIQEEGNAVLVHADNDLIHKILTEMANRIENIEQKNEVERKLK